MPRTVDQQPDAPTMTDPDATPLCPSVTSVVKKKRPQEGRARWFRSRREDGQRSTFNQPWARNRRSGGSKPLFLFSPQSSSQRLRRLKAFSNSIFRAHLRQDNYFSNRKNF